VFVFAGEETPTEGRHDIGQQEHNLRPGGHHRARQRGRKDVHASQQQVQRWDEKRAAATNIQRRRVLRG